MIYGRPVIQVSASLDMFFERLLPRTIPPLTDMDWRAGKLKEFIDSQPGKVRWNLDDVSRELGLSMSGRQARRLFMASTGVGVREYAKKKRLTSAAARLQATNAPVKAIAAEAGYQSTCHFARSFKELFRLSPLEFRRIWRRQMCAA
jgi:transcriptional regulator GlxA family with amidase domain